MIFDEGGERKEVKQVGEVAPNICVSVLAQTLVVKPVNLSDLSTFVVSTEDCDAVTVTELHRYKESYGFDGIVPSVYVVAHKEVICVR